MGGNVVGLIIVAALLMFASGIMSRKHRGYWWMGTLFAAVIAAVLLLAK
jgi:hypothetical protein